MTDYDWEPIAGLPQPLPENERILWQGRPDWRILAVQGFRLRWLVGYFAILVVWTVGLAWQAGAPIDLGVIQASWLALLGGAVIGAITLFAWLCAKNTVYTITNRRLVIRSGIALDMAVNLPFPLIDSAGLRANRDGSGDVVVAMAPGQRVALLSVWPHARPWRFREPQPMLRAIPDAADVARLLARALATNGGGSVTAPIAAAERPAAAPDGLPA